MFRHECCLLGGVISFRTFKLGEHRAGTSTADEAGLRIEGRALSRAVQAVARSLVRRPSVMLEGLRSAAATLFHERRVTCRGRFELRESAGQMTGADAKPAVLSGGYLLADIHIGAYRWSSS